MSDSEVEKVKIDSVCIEQPLSNEAIVTNNRADEISNRECFESFCNFCNQCLDDLELICCICKLLQRLIP
ncbi:unnamed protein product [Brachionus calyciflorus]|uniref:Uncharacterized protein n=1 Tax=Brachionus calyciflorus TaxID=104777 RepID=A0A814BPE6_9BILA|nr:unnamed protein product [Brachionus calyciflorus]